MKGSLLIVDDEQDIVDMLSRHFTFLGYDVRTASNGKEAVEILSKYKTDVIISDIVMPEMEGTDLLRVVRAQYPMIHTIIITGYVTLQNALTCMRLGADNCVFKPLEDLSELEQSVEDARSSLKRWQSKLVELKGMKQG